MKRGDWVRVRVYGDEIVTRRVVEIDGDMIAICRDEEYQAARRERREPVTVGFWIEDIVEVDQSSAISGSEPDRSQHDCAAQR